MLLIDCYRCWIKFILSYLTQGIVITHYLCWLRWCHGFVPVFTHAIYYHSRFSWILFDFGLDYIALIQCHALASYCSHNDVIWRIATSNLETKKKQCIYTLWSCTIRRHNIMWHRIYRCNDWRRTQATLWTNKWHLAIPRGPTLGNVL